jgi:hypothetical protein
MRRWDDRIVIRAELVDDPQITLVNDPQINPPANPDLPPMPEPPIPPPSDEPAIILPPRPTEPDPQSPPPVIEDPPLPGQSPIGTTSGRGPRRPFHTRFLCNKKTSSQTVFLKDRSVVSTR